MSLQERLSTSENCVRGLKVEVYLSEAGGQIENFVQYRKKVKQRLDDEQKRRTSLEG